MSVRVLDVDARGERLDRFLARRLESEGLSRGYCRELIDRGLVTVDGVARKADYRMRDGDRVRVDESGPAWPELDLDSWVLHEDDALLVLRKPSGLLMHPLGETWLKRPEAACSELEPNLAGLLLRKRSGIAEAGTPRCGLVHRLDRPTSGVLLVAKTPAAHEALVRAFSERRVAKTYRAIVLGEPPKPRIDVDAPVGRVPGRRRMEVLPWGRPAQTEFRVVEAANGVSLIEADPKTGRTHQIRVHLSEVGLPVLGDPEAIGAVERARIQELALPRPPRLMLHAYRVRLAHPKTGKRLTFTAQLPKDFKDYWASLKSRWP